MPVPKSVTKITKDGVTFTSNVEACNYYIYELCRAALRDVAKFVKKEFRKKYYETFKKRLNRGGKGIQHTVYSSKKTTSPRVDIGWKSNIGFYSSFQEVGTKKTPKLGLLAKSVEENIDQIIKIQSQYLSYLNEDEIPDSIISEEEDED